MFVISKYVANSVCCVKCVCLYFVCVCGGGELDACVYKKSTLTATVDPFLPQPPVNITRMLLNANIADTATAPYSGNVLTSSRCPNIGS